MNPQCARCGKVVYPTEKVNCLDKVRARQVAEPAAAWGEGRPGKVEGDPAGMRGEGWARNCFAMASFLSLCLRHRLRFYVCRSRTTPNWDILEALVSFCGGAFEILWGGRD